MSVVANDGPRCKAALRVALRAVRRMAGQFGAFTRQGIEPARPLVQVGQSLWRQNGAADHRQIGRRLRPYEQTAEDVSNYA